MKAFIRVSDYMEEFRELVHVFIPASCREQVLGEMICIPPSGCRG